MASSSTVNIRDISAIKYDGYGHAVDGIVNSTRTLVHDPAPSPKTFANPSPLGLFAFASTSFVLSMINVQARSVNVPNVTVGMAVFVGGLAQLLAGMWEFALGNTYGATFSSLYGGFWLAYAAILIPGSGIEAAYSTTHGQEPDAVGIFLACSFLVTFIFLLGSLRVSIMLIATLTFLDVTYALLMIGEFTRSVTITKAGGWFGLITAALAYYLGAAQLINTENSFFNLPVGTIRKKHSD
jgi:hypothetical protein